MIYIFDLDGTLALCDHRRHLVEKDPPDWDEFYAQCIHDKPNKPIVELCRTLQDCGHDIWIFSGRSDVVKDETREWLAKHSITSRWLKMRPEGDYTPDDVLKERWINESADRHLIVCVFDDRQKVVDMWRRKGFVCCQVAEGNF